MGLVPHRIPTNLSYTFQFVRAFLDSITGANRAAKDVLSPAFSWIDGTIQLPPTPAGPDRASPLIRSTGASPSIQFASTSEIPSIHALVLLFDGCGLRFRHHLPPLILLVLLVLLVLLPPEFRLRWYGAFAFEPAAPVI